MAIDLGKSVVVVAWHNPKQLAEFKREWRVDDYSPVIFQEDTNGEGCAETKNKGIKKAYNSGAEMICVLDDDCFPNNKHYYPFDLRGLLLEHREALLPQAVQRVVPTTTPKPRGMPYYHTSMQMPVAASMGFWTNIPDFDAIAALQLGPTATVTFNQRPVFGEYFPFCGMNFAFHRDWIDCAQLINAARWDDIWMGWIWEKIAYEKGFCFNLNGPVVRHSRQSNVWQNLREEAKYIEQNETLWEKIANTPHGLSAGSIRKLCIDPLLPKPLGKKPPEWMLHGIGNKPLV